MLHFSQCLLHLGGKFTVNVQCPKFSSHGGGHDLHCIVNHAVVGGKVVSVDMKKYPPALLLALGS